MRKRALIILSSLLLILALLFAWQLPAILKALPSRYVARLPEPVQALGVREHVEMLPTAAVNQDSSHLLLGASAESGDPSPEEYTPATPTPPPTAGSTTSSVAAPAPTQTLTAVDVNSATPTPTTVPLPASTRLTGVQHRFQTWNNCGPATLSMALTYFDIYHSQDQTASVMKPDPEDRNVSPEEMASYVREETELSAISRANGDLQTLRHLLSEGFPVIVEVGIDPPGEYRWMGWYGHYLLVLAYDDSEESFWVYDSWFGTSDVPAENADNLGRQISYDTLSRYWMQFNRSYITLFEAEDEPLVSQIIGAQMDDATMWEKALLRTQSELNQDPENAFLWFNLGTNFNALADYERAAAAFDRARSIGLPWRMLWYQFGPYEAYYQTGRYEDVVVLADVTLQDRPYFEESYYYKALAQIELGEVDDAQKNLQKAIDFNPNFTLAADALERLEVAGK